MFPPFLEIWESVNCIYSTITRNFVVKMDGMRLSGQPSGICIGTRPIIFNNFKETQNTGTDRVLEYIKN
jgi:hypothetical protein